MSQVQTTSILPFELRDVGFEADGRELLSAVSMRVEPGAPTVLMGPNGAGKSLTLRIAHGLLAPGRGEVHWQAGSGRQAMVFERPVLLRRSAAANVEYALAVAGVPRADRAARVAEVLEKTGLAPLADRRARVLSAGEAQRLSLARAWALEPEVLFLDEPTAALDPSASAAIESLIRVISESGTKIVMTTHDLGQARRLAGDVALLVGGRLVERAAADTFFDAPETAEAQAFLKGELLWESS
jgi:tungstate transport system ATP-binding protein